MALRNAARSYDTIFDFRSMAAIAAAAAISVTGAVYPSSVSYNETNKAYAADDGNDDWIHAKGSRLYDMNGNEVWRGPHFLL